MDNRLYPTPNVLDWGNSRRALSARLGSLGLLHVRLGLFTLLFSLEWIPMPNLLHKNIGASRPFHLVVVFVAFFLAFAYARATTELQWISHELERRPIGWNFLLCHFYALLAFVAVSFLPFGGHMSGATAYLMAALWILAGATAIVLAGFAFVPPKVTMRLVRCTGHTWAYALTAATVAWSLAGVFRVWNGVVLKLLTDLTFSSVNGLLRLFVSDVIANRATMKLGNPSFSVTVSPFCSGVEGSVLMLVFSVAWLLFFRRELRFPRAFLLVPAAMSILWLTNAVRITALILIGISGAKDVALNGFHSEAGWIAFNCVALGFVLVAQRIPWFTTAPSTEVQKHNPTLAYLAPFLAVLAAAMISRAASGGFEWLYPLRFAAAGTTLWFFRSSYKDLDWKFGWIAPIVGSLVFAIWVALDAATGPHTGKGIAAGLAALPASARIIWLALRTAGAVITVPIAEELAFRGFLLRRPLSSDFQLRGTKEFTYLSLLLSSVAFGLLHGDRWIAGSVAGLLYAGAMLKRGSIGDAVVAHAITNGLLAVWVLAGGRWDLW